MPAPDTTTAVVAAQYGGPEVLELHDVPLPAPQAGEITLEVRAAGVNPIDWKLYGGGYGGRPADPALLPLRVGAEAAGVVVAVGENADGPEGPISEGDEVIVFRAPGAYAAHLTLPGHLAVRKPANVSFEEAAGLLLAGCTAEHCLVAVDLEAGQTLLIHGASGGVGWIGVQLAVERGATVIGTGREENHAALRALGAIPTTYGPGLLERVRELAPDGIDAVLDAAGTDEALDTSLALVDPKRVAQIVASPRAFEAGMRVLGGAPGADPGTEIRANARPTLARLLGERKISIEVHAHPMSEVAAVHRESMELHTRGKLVLVP